MGDHRRSVTHRSEPGLSASWLIRGSSPGAEVVRAAARACYFANPAPLAASK